jgi:flagellar biosynthetic protein FliR
MLISAIELQEWLLRFVGAFARVGAAMMVAPIFGAGLVAMRIRLVAAAVVTVLVMTALPAATAPTEPLGPLQLFKEVMLGAAIGFVVQTAFDVLVMAGQVIGLSMGLGFANLIDPQHGVTVPVIGQLYLLLALLIFVTINGHIAFIELLAGSFKAMPVGSAMLDDGNLATLVAWGGRVFSGGLQVALPAVVAMTVVNVAFGVMSRAAPQLNLFGVGFPITIILGFMTLWMSLESLAPTFGAILDEALDIAGALAHGAG